MAPRQTRPDDPPSPRPYVRVVDSYARDLRRAVLTVLREARRMRESQRVDVDDPDPGEALARSLVLELVLGQQLASLPPPPTPERVSAAVQPLAERAVRGARRSLRRAGMPSRLIAIALGLPPTATDGELVQVGLDLGGGEAELLARWAQEGVDLIESVRADLIPDLRRHIIQAAREGKRWEQIADVALARLHVSRSRMRLIARDQTAKLNGRLTQHLQERAGVTEYRWRTSRDQRVRESHAAQEGQVFRWDSPPPTGHPGQDYQCRCVAEAVLPE